MRINKRPRQTYKTEELLDASVKYESVEMLSYVDDSLVKLIYINPVAKAAIVEWCEKSIEGKIPREVAEVGGFLLGKYKKERQHCITVIDKFIPSIEIEAHDKATLEFGRKPLIKLDKIREEKYASLIVVGWFHTHPGHTPYLSSFDMNIQAFFREPYHVAIVLDTLTPNFDTGIFTWRTTGEINNKIHYKKWLSWKSSLKNSLLRKEDASSV